MDSLPAEPQGKSKNTGVGSLSLLQQIFPTQKLNRGLLHCRRILYQPSYRGALTSPWQFMVCGGAQFLKALVSLAWILPWKERNWKQESHVVSALVTLGSLAGALRPQAFTGASLSPPCPSFLPHLSLFSPCCGSSHVSWSPSMPSRSGVSIHCSFLWALKVLSLCVTIYCIPSYLLCQLHLFIDLTGLKVP